MSTLLSSTTANYASLNSDQARSLLLGVALGDALGVPVEFQDRAARQQDPVTEMRGYGTYWQPAGTWSDDASLTFCLAEALADGFTLENLAANCVRWWRQAWWTAHGQVFDIGITTAESLRRLEQGVPAAQAGGRREGDNGNGALMRILPLLGRLSFDPAQAAAEFRLVQDVADLTHGHVRSAAACWLYLSAAHWLRTGYSPAEAYNRLRQEGLATLRHLGVAEEEVVHFGPLLGGDLATWPEDRVQSGGYVLHTLEAALWCLLRHNTYADTVLAAVNLGYDTDTTSAVAGGLAGLYYGEASFPAEWLALLARRTDIEALASRMEAGLGHP